MHRHSRNSLVAHARGLLSSRRPDRTGSGLALLVPRGRMIRFRGRPGRAPARSQAPSCNPVAAPLRRKQTGPLGNDRCCQSSRNGAGRPRGAGHRHGGLYGSARRPRPAPSGSRAAMQARRWAQRQGEARITDRTVHRPAQAAESPPSGQVGGRGWPPPIALLKPIHAWLGSIAARKTQAEAPTPRRRREGRTVDCLSPEMAGEGRRLARFIEGPAQGEKPNRDPS